MKINDILTEAPVAQPDQSKVQQFLKRYVPGAKMTQFMQSQTNTPKGAQPAKATSLTTQAGVVYEVKASIWTGRPPSPSRPEDIADADLKVILAKTAPAIGALKNKDKITSFVIQLGPDPASDNYYFEFKRGKMPKLASQTPADLAKAKETKAQVDAINASTKSAAEKAAEIKALLGDTYKAFKSGAKGGTEAIPDMTKAMIGKMFSQKTKT